MKIQVNMKINIKVCCSHVSRYELGEKMLICEEGYAGYVDSCLPTFRDSILALASRKKQFSWID